MKNHLLKDRSHKDTHYQLKNKKGSLKEGPQSTPRTSSQTKENPRENHRKISRDYQMHPRSNRNLCSHRGTHSKVKRMERPDNHLKKRSRYSILRSSTSSLRRRTLRTPVPFYSFENLCTQAYLRE